MSCVIIPWREDFYCLPREIFFPAERVKKDRAHPIFGVIYIQGDISRQLAPKGLLSTAQGTALGIRKLRTMRPVRAALTFLFFYSCPYRARWLFISVYPGRCPGLWMTLGFQLAEWRIHNNIVNTGLWMTLGFQPVQAMEDIGLSCLGKRQSRAQPVSPFLYYIYHSIFRMKLKNLSLHIPHETKKTQQFQFIAISCNLCRYFRPKPIHFIDASTLISTCFFRQ